MDKRQKSGGRVAGTPNKLTTEMRSKINDFLANSWADIKDNFNELDAKDKLAFYEKLLQYGLPKLQAVELTGDYNFESLSDYDLDRLISKLKDNDETRQS